MKKNLSLYLIVAAIVVSGLSACHTGAPVEPKTAVDNGTWPVPADAGDVSVKPGDDFYMYCNGGFWKSATVDESKAENKCIALVEVPRLMNQRIEALNFPSLEKMKKDIALRDEATLTKQQQRAQAAIARVNAVQTVEEGWQMMALMMKEGYHLPVNISIFSRKGRMAACIRTDFANDYAAPMLLSENDFEWRLANDPKMLASLRPVSGGATKSIDAEKWPMLFNIMQTLGVAPEDAYILDEQQDFVFQNMVDNQDLLIKMIQDMDVEGLKNNILLPAISSDAVLYSGETSLTQDQMINAISQNYLRYERSKVFADAYVTAEMKQRTIAICEQMRESFHLRIDASEWMSENAKQSARRKVEAMTFNVGCPDQWLQAGLPDLGNCETILDDVLTIRGALLRLNLSLIGKPTSEASFHNVIANLMDLTVVNASYLTNANAMNIWPTWIMEPYYQDGANEAYNYATFMVTGHEMTHGFDTNGAHFNWQGDLENLFAGDADRQEYQNRAQQLIDCYNSFEVMPWALPGLHADGAYTVSENIADLGGFLIAYDTYVRHLREKGFTGEQYDQQRRRFYLAYAWLWHGKYTAKFAQMYVNGLDEGGTGKNIHSLFRERINGVVMNTDDWYELFSIQPEDKLYCKEEDRVRIW